MRLQITFALFLLLGIVVFAGCYTQIGYHAATDFDRRYHRVVTEEETEEHVEVESEQEKAMPEHSDVETDDGYYGRRKYTRRSTYVYPGGYYAPYWGHYPYYPSHYYLPVAPYYSYPWVYGYGYYGYAPRYYYPYTNVYRRYHGGGSRYVPHSRRTYTPHPEQRRSRSSRGVTSPQPRSERPQRGTRSRNGK